MPWQVSSAPQPSPLLHDQSTRQTEQHHVNTTASMASICIYIVYTYGDAFSLQGPSGLTATQLRLSSSSSTGELELSAPLCQVDTHVWGIKIGHQLVLSTVVGAVWGKHCS